MSAKKCCGECRDGEIEGVDAVARVIGMAYVDGGHMVPYRRYVCAPHLEEVQTDKLHPGCRIEYLTQEEGDK